MIFAYIDPSVMSYTIQALAGIAIALGVVFGVFWRKAKRVVNRTLGRDENADRELEPSVLRLDPADRAAFAVAAEVAQDLAARVDARLVRPDRPRCRAAVVVGSLALYVAVVLPLQTYLSSADAFPFSLVRLLPELAGCFAVFALGLAALAWLFAKVRLADYFASFLTAALVCIYLETGLLSLGLPVLNGAPVPQLADVLRIAVDFVVWAVVVVAFVALTRWLRPYLQWVALSVLVLSVAAIGDVSKLASADAPALDAALPLSRFVPQPTVVANVKYSPSRNVLMFVLDSMPGKTVADLVRTNQALLAKFPGFTAYPHNVGMHECTKRGVPGLVTGRHYDPATMPEIEYPMTMYGTNSVVVGAAAAGWAVAFSPDLLPYGFTNLPVEKRVARAETRRSRDAFAFLRQSTEAPNLSLFDVVAFRLSPFCFKGPILYSRIRHAVKGRHSHDSFWGERTLYPALAACPVATDGKPFFGIFHSMGVHPPWATDLATEVSQKLTHLGELMDAYRAAGIYDRSLIIVTSDHGLDLAEPVDGFPPSASAILWVKPEGATAPYAESDLRTSHVRISSLVRTVLAGPLSGTRCAEALQDGDRLYRAAVREGGRERFRDWRDAHSR